jgi:hypothetical protein
MKTRKIKPDVEVENKRENQTLPPSSETFIEKNFKWIVTGAVALCSLIYFLRLDRVSGMVRDDAWYALIAKAIATGQGYNLINSPTPGIFPLYPPAYPLLLAVFFKIAPQYPNNVYALKLVSIIAMAGLGVAAYYYFSNDRHEARLTALAIAVFIVLCPGFVFLATSTLMSECLYAVLQFTAIWVIEKVVKAKDSPTVWRYSLLGGFLISYTFLTRSIGIGLILAVLLYLLKEKMTRQLIIVGAVIALIAGSWMLYSRFRMPTEAQRLEQNSYIVQPYTNQFWQKEIGSSESGTQGVFDLPGRAWDNSIKMGNTAVANLFLAPLHRRPDLSGLELFGIVDGTLWYSWTLSLLVIIGYIHCLRARITLSEIVIPFTLGIIALWPWDPLRFMLPLLPFLAYYCFCGIRAIYLINQKFMQQVKTSGQSSIVAITAGILILLFCYDHTMYIIRKHSSDIEKVPVWLRGYAENQKMLNWMNEHITQENITIATNNPGLVYLWTGKKSVGNESVSKTWELWKTLNVRYLTYLGFKSDIPERAVQEFPYKTTYVNGGQIRNDSIESAMMNLPKELREKVKKERSQTIETVSVPNMRVVDLGDPETRPKWGSLERTPAPQ